MLEQNGVHLVAQLDYATTIDLFDLQNLVFSIVKVMFYRRFRQNILSFRHANKEGLRKRNQR